MKIKRSVTLAGDQIENAFNIDAMIHAAEMFASKAVFREPDAESENVLTLTDTKKLSNDFTHRIALDNLKNAQVLYGYDLPEAARAVIIAGNERRGISREVTDIATHAITIPMVSKQLNCINVAAASAVALYYLSSAHKGRLQTHKAPNKRRPELILIAGKNHAELGSAIRSAAAFGWDRAFIEDRENVWFGCDRVTKSEGRAAARRGRNQIRLVPTQSDNQYLFKEAVIITTKNVGNALPKVELCKGGNQALVLVDESEIDVLEGDWGHIAKSISFAQIEIPVAEFTYHYRHTASIALAEASRQIGQRPTGKTFKQEPLYESSLKLIADELGEVVDLADLGDY